MRSFVALLAMAIARALVAQSSGTTVLEDIEHRPATLLNGERHTIVDPCFTGYFNFHHEIRTDSFYRNAPRQPESIPPVDYDFSKSPLLKVPGDWNTQSSDLFLYEDPVWYQRDFDYEAKAGLHGTADERWTAEFQANLYKHQLVMLNKVQQLRGLSPWVLMDFRSPWRLLPGIQDHFNRKGLISDQGKHKEALCVLQKAYTDKTIGSAAAKP